VNDADLFRRYQEMSKAGILPPIWLLGLHKKQKEAVEHESKQKAIVAGRRGGKTFVALAVLYHAARNNPDSVALYLALTARSARTILWSSLVRFNRIYNLGMDLRRGELTAALDNGSTIMLSGADQEDSTEKLRGPAYSAVVIDEAASFGELRYLIEEVLEPALADFDGSLWMVGSPGAACAGYFYDASTGLNPDVPKWDTFHWDMRDNPRFKGRAGEYFERKKTQKGWTDGTPAFRREYLGQWVKDADWLVYAFDRGRNCIREAPAGMSYVLSVDIGASDVQRSTAFGVLGYIPGRMAALVKAYKRAGMTVSSIGEELDGLIQVYSPHKIVMDPGGLGGGYVKELKSRIQIPVCAAEKQHKLAYIELCNSDLRTGKLRVVEQDCADLLSEIEILQWDEKRKAPDPRFLDHACDMLLYGWRECRHFVHSGEVTKPKPPPGMDRRQAEMEAFEDEEDDDSKSAFRRIIGTR
jgi:hypothetical protein